MRPTPDSDLPGMLVKGCLLWMLLVFGGCVAAAIAMSFLAWLGSGGY